MDQDWKEIYNFENEKYKDYLTKISHQNKGVEFVLKKGRFNSLTI